MAYHSGNQKPKKSTNAEKLREHAKHHTKNHIDMMKKLMKEGKSFSQAHNIVMKKIGK
jgi:hypothetical protein